MYIHGGFDQDSPNVPTDRILRMDLALAFRPDTSLFKALSSGTGKDYYTTKGIKGQPGSNYNSAEKHEQQHQLYLQQQSLQKNNEYRRPAAGGSASSTRAIRLCPEVIVASYDEQTTKKVELDKLHEENRRLKDVPVIQNSKATLEKLYNPFINAFLLKPGTLAFNTDAINAMLFEVEKVLNEEHSLLRLRVPIKVFGDLHGQLGDLNRMFEAFGAPADDVPQGDIEANDYLFLGDYVDRGNKSL